MSTENFVPVEAEIVGKPGIASNALVSTDAGSSWKQTAVEKLSNRHRVVSFDFELGQSLEKKVKQRIEHLGQKILCLGYKELWRKGTGHDDTSLKFLSEFQEVWAADEMHAPARWIKARDLIPGRHFLKLAITSNPWAELVMAEVPKWERYNALPVHELILIDSDSYSVGGLLCRATSVPSTEVKKRLVYPLKDFPAVNFVPQPKTLGAAQAEVWYRKSAALLPRCIDESVDPRTRLQAMVALKQLMRDVAAKANIEPGLKDEFIAKHPVPTLEQLVPDLDRLQPHELKGAIDAAVNVLSAPGEQRYSEFTGGMESQYIRLEKDVYLSFDGMQWVQTISSRNLNLPE